MKQFKNREERFNYLHNLFSALGAIETDNDFTIDTLKDLVKTMNFVDYLHTYNDQVCIKNILLVLLYEEDNGE